MTLPTSGILPPKALEDIRLHTNDFFETSWWAVELDKIIQDPTHQMTGAQEGDMTMMMMVMSQMTGFKEQWHETDLSIKEIIYAVGQLIATNDQTRQQAERAVQVMVDKARQAKETGTTPTI